MSRSLSRNRAALKLQAGKVGVSARVEVTPAGLLAVTALVSSILLSTTALVQVASTARRRRRTLPWR